MPGRDRGSSKRRERGSIIHRGKSYRVLVYAGVDPLTGNRVYLDQSTTDPDEAQRILTRFRSQVDSQRQARTKATLRTTIEEWLKVHEIDDSTRQGYEGYLRLQIGPALGDVPLGKISARVLEKFYAELRRCSVRCDGGPRVDHRTTRPHECRLVRHRRPRGRPPAGGHPGHDCAVAGCTTVACPPHTCKPLSNATILKIHYVISGALSAAQRWEWIGANPAEVTKKPRQPIPDPQPPTPEQAAKLIAAAWAEDEAWGTLVWLVMVTGMRRAELLALRWSDIDLKEGKVAIRRNYVRAGGRLREKDTKTHRARRISLDPATVTVLTEHRQRYDDTMRRLHLTPTDEAFLFSYEATWSRPYEPSGATHRYSRMCERLGLSSHLHAMRHYSATELLTAGVDLRTVAGRLGHGGGGATTLRVYAAWVGESDSRAAGILGSQFTRPQATGPGRAGVNECSVPDNIAQAVEGRWPERGRPWLDAVQPELAELTRRYSARPTGVFPARYGFVIELSRADASPLVLRATADPDGPRQAKVAEQLGAIGAGPKVHEIRATDTGTWTVMDRVFPGTPVDLGADLADLATALRPLVAQQPRLPDLPPLTAWLRARLTDDDPADLPLGLSVAPPAERDQALALLAGLGDGPADLLCHGDCSRGNVLRSGEGLALIDPRGMAGEIAYDVAVLAAKTGNSPAALAELLGLDGDRAETWAVIAAAARV